MKNKIKILQIVPSLSQANGIATFCVNYLNNIDLSKFSIDFLVLYERNHDYYEVVTSKKSKIFELKFNQLSLKNKILSYKKIDKIFKENRYDIVHCHAPNFGFLTQYIAKKAGIKRRIIHSHAAVSSGKKINKLRNNLIEPFAVKYSTDLLACSEVAGVALFKDKKFSVINNGIDCSDFFFSDTLRKKTRRKLGINDDEILIGTVGRLSKEKNQSFLIEILKETIRLNIKCKLLFVGDGPEKENLLNLVKENNLEKQVLFLGVQYDVNRYYNALDLFMLPSLAEGLGIVLIEAQLTGVKCIASKDRVPEKTKYTNLVEFLPIDNSIDLWVDRIANYTNFERKTRLEDFVKSEFNIKNEIKKLEKFYLDVK